MFSNRYGTFTGGIDLPDEKRATLHRAIVPCPPPSFLRVPLSLDGGPAARVTVVTGQRVCANESLAVREDGTGTIFAPLEGTVGAIDVSACVAAGDDFAAVPAIELRDLSRPAAIPSAKTVFDWRATGVETLLQRFAEGGLTTFRRPVEGLDCWVRRAIEKKCRTLVINAMEGQPYVTADHRLLVEHGEEVIRGLALLAQAMNVGEMVLAADHRFADEYRRLLEPARSLDVNMIALPHKYPTGCDTMLVKILTRREVPLGGEEMDVGVGVLDPATCQAAYRWAACGIGPAGRVVTVGGERIGSPANYFVPFGTPCEILTGTVSGPVLHNGPMVGLCCPSGAVVGPATDAVLALEPVQRISPRPCIRCSWCTDHCPARLNVATLNDDYELSDLKHAQRAGACACVECGVCTYVCPSKLPLSQRVKQLKRLIRRDCGCRREARCC